MHMRLPVLIFLAAEALFLPRQVLGGDLYLSVAGYSSQLIEIGNGQYLYVYVVSDMWPPQGLSQIKFAIPTPPCVELVDLYPQPSSGSVETGAVFDFNDCATGRKTIVNLIYRTTIVDSCCPLMIRPYDSRFEFTVEGADCNGFPVRVDRTNVVLYSPGMTGCGGPTVPSNPWPPDGATNVPLAPELLWESEPTAGTGLGVFETRLFFGLTPNPPLINATVYPPHPLGPLAPSTTYYWQVISIVYDFGGAGVGPVWHFTTTSSTPIRSSTWGAIKALYR